MKLCWIKILQKIFLRKTFWLIYIDDDDDTQKNAIEAIFNDSIINTLVVKYCRKLLEVQQQ